MPGARLRVCREGVGRWPRLGAAEQRGLDPGFGLSNFTSWIGGVDTSYWSLYPSPPAKEAAAPHIILGTFRNPSLSDSPHCNQGVPPDLANQNILSCDWCRDGHGTRAIRSVFLETLVYTVPPNTGQCKLAEHERPKRRQPRCHQEGKSWLTTKPAWRKQSQEEEAGRNQVLAPSFSVWTQLHLKLQLPHRPVDQEYHISFRPAETVLSPDRRAQTLT